jgi:protein SCO1/2
MNRTAVGILLVVTAALVGLLLFGRSSPPPDLHGHLLRPPLPAPQVDPTLHSSEGPVRLTDLHGAHTVLFFGYTHCPDVCPLTLARVARAKELMAPEAAERLRVVMVSVDPERDTPELTDAYARRFDPAFRGLSGERAEIESLASAYGIFHGKARGPAGEGENYLVDHTASLLVLDPAGRVRMMLAQDLSAEEIAADLDWLVGGA